MSFSDTFYENIDQIMFEYPMIPYKTKSYYAQMLVVLEQVMRSTEPLLTLAAPHHPYFKHHLEGERGHHAWVVEDLRELDLDWFSQPLYPEIAQMVGMQFYHVVVGRPIALMGYLAALEGYPSTDVQIAMLKELYPNASQTMAKHAAIDTDHRAELVEELDKLPEDARPYVLGNGIHCAQLYRDALWRLIALGDRKYGTDPR
jgi:hypothetical protein